MVTKNYLIAGASSGIGAALKKILEDEGHRVFTLGRNPIYSSGHLFFNAESSDNLEFPAEWPDVFHGLAYCPGTINLKPFHRFTQSDFLQDYQVNVLGFVKVAQAVFPRLKKADGSSVVVFSTVATRIGLGFHTSISAAKGALEGLALSMASEWVGHKIRVNVVAPSLTDTPLAAQLLGSPEKAEASAKRHPLQRVGLPEDIAKAARYFLSEDSSWVSGQVLTVDGGMSRMK